DLQQPDRLEIRAEEQSRRPQHVVAVEIARVTLGVSVKDCAAERGEAFIEAKRRQHRPMNGTLGEPQLIPVDPEPVVELTGENLSAHGTPVVARTSWVELEQCAVARASAPFARQKCLFRWNEDFSREPWLEIRGERERKRPE